MASKGKALFSKIGVNSAHNSALKNPPLGPDETAINLDEVARFGIAGNVCSISHDWQQSLAAIATDKGSIYVLGQSGVEVVLHITPPNRIIHLCLHGSILLAIDERNILYSWALETSDTEPTTIYALRNVVGAVYLDPASDWLYIGMRDGTCDVWDVPAEQLAPYRIKNMYLERYEEWRLMEYAHAPARHSVSPICSIQSHPSDLGLLLVAYQDGAVLYSFKEAIAKRFFELSIPSDDGSTLYRPTCNNASFSPDGRFILTTHLNGLFAFWDVKNEEVPLYYRSLAEVDYNLLINQYSLKDGGKSRVINLVAVWCCRSDPSDTYILLSGLQDDQTELHVLDYGTPPTKSQEWTRFFANPKKEKIVPIASRSCIKAICCLGMVSPFHIAHEPSHVLLSFYSGDISILSLPTGDYTPAALLSPSLGLRCYKPALFAIADVARATVQMLQQKNIGKTNPLTGGSPAKRNLRYHDPRQILAIACTDARVLLYDISYGDMSQLPFLDLDVSMVTSTSALVALQMSQVTGELAVGTDSGTVILYKLHTKQHGEPKSSRVTGSPSNLTQIPMPSPVPEAAELLHAFTGDVSIGLNPSCLIRSRSGPGNEDITCLLVSQVGFMAIGYGSGTVMLCDLRGPAIIMMHDLSEHQARQSLCAETASTFALLATGMDGRLSLVLSCGTSFGRVLFFEILRNSNGTFEPIFHHQIVTSKHVPVLYITSIGSNGIEEIAGLEHLSALYNEVTASSRLIVVTAASFSVHFGLTEKSISSKFDNSKATSAQLIRETHVVAPIVALAVSFETGKIMCYTIPEARLLSTTKLPISIPAGSSVCITGSGDIVAFTNTTEIGLFSLLGTDKKPKELDYCRLFDASKTIPSRPVISTWDWIIGTQYVKSEDLDLLIGGANRPNSRRERDQLRNDKGKTSLDNANTRRAETASESVQATKGNQNANGIFSQVAKAVADRGDKLSGVNQSMDGLERATGDWLKEIDKVTRDVKKKAVLGGLKNMFF